MPDDLSDRLEQLEAQLQALTNITLSHIAASDALVPGTAKETVEYAATQRDAALKLGRHLIAIRLDMMIDELRTVLGFDL